MKFSNPMLTYILAIFSLTIASDEIDKEKSTFNISNQKTRQELETPSVFSEINVLQKNRVLKKIKKPGKTKKT